MCVFVCVCVCVCVCVLKLTNAILKEENCCVLIRALSVCVSSSIGSCCVFVLNVAHSGIMARHPPRHSNPSPVWEIT